MKNLIYFIIIFFALNLQLFANKITAFQYWYDNDTSNAKSITIQNPAADFTLTDSLDVTNLGYGLHIFNIKFKDSLNNWTPTESTLFWVIKDTTKAVVLNSNNIKEYEYWFDSDLLNKKVLTIANPVSSYDLFDSIDVSSLSHGVHSLHLRFKDSMNYWCAIESNLFWVDLNGRLVPLYPDNKIVDFEYWFDNCLTTKNNINFVTPTNNLTYTDSLNIDQIGTGKRVLNYRFKDSYNNRSSIFSDEFESLQHISQWEYIQFGNQVSFISNTKYYQKNRWEFGDGTTDSVLNPLHIYTKGGIFNVKNIVENLCWKDTLTQQISITGLQTYSPQTGGNSGKVTLILYGVGFTDSTIVKLIDSSQSTIKVIIPDDLIWNSNNPSILKAVFNLNNKPIGVWDIFLDKLNDITIKQFRKPDAFTIELGAKPDPFIDIVGNSRIRSGVAQTYNVTFGNRANIDATGTLFYISLKGSSIEEVSFDFDFAKPDSILNYDSLPQYFTPEKLNGQSFNGRIYPIYIPLIQANSNFTVKMKIKTNNDFAISGWANPPMFSENLQQIAYKQEDETQGVEGSDVTKCIVDFAMKKANDAVDEALEELPGYNCVNTYIESWKDIYNYNTENYIIDKPAGVFGNLLWNLSKITVDCILDFVPAGKYKKIADFVKKTVEFATEVQDGFEDGQEIAKCASTFTKLAIQELPTIIAINSFDPNEKSGPGGGQTAKWVRSDKEFSYSILFENKSTASAAAQVVTILDTLSKANLDLSTFQLKTFECGTITRYVPPGLKEYATEIDLRPMNKNLILRIYGKLDTNTGIAKWEYKSLDPITKSLTEDPILGFLEPNSTPPIGEGKVTYSVRPKKNLSNNLEIRNKAKILFDANEPILTNDWKTRIDNNKPQSFVSELQPVIFDSSFVVDWSSNDEYGDVLMTLLFVSTNNGPYYLWSQNIDTTSALFTGKFGSTYKFYSIGVDYAGNIETSKTNYDTYTTLIKLLPPVLVSPLNNQQYVNYKPSFEWDEVEFADNYDIQVSDTSDFSNIVFEKSNISATSISMTDDSLIYLMDYYWRVRTIRGTLKSEWSEFFIFETQGAPETVPDSWEYTDSTGKNAIVKIPYNSQPKIGNRDLLNGDAIGFFFSRNDSLICAGYKIWNDSDIEVTIWGDDENTQIKDGYSDNEQFRVFIWDAQQNVQREAIVDYSSGNDFFLDGGYSVLSSLTTNVTQEINLYPGWNMVSAYLYPEITELENLLADNYSNIVIMKNNNGDVFIPSYNVNTIENWNTLDGYLVYMNSEDTYKLTGTPAIPEDTQIPLTSGWNIISYLLNSELDCETAFASITDDSNLIIVKDNFGNVYIPAYGINTIGNLVPGQGYQIYVMNADVLVYPGN